MEFTASISIDACRRRLTSHETRIAAFADTRVVLNRLPDNRTQFAVRRVWTGVQNWFQYPILQVTGMLTPTSSARTTITVYFEVRELGLLLLGLLFLLLLLALSHPQVVSAWVMILALGALLAYETYVLRRVIRDLRA